MNPIKQIEFDDTAPVLTARRVVDQGQWANTIAKWHKTAAKALKSHPWAGMTSTAVIDDLRGTAAPKPSGRK